MDLKKQLEKLDKSELDWIISNELSYDEIIEIIMSFDEDRKNTVKTNLNE